MRGTSQILYTNWSLVLVNIWSLDGREMEQAQKPLGDSRAVIAAPGLHFSKEVCSMISDDFEKIMRQMIEQFFGGPVPMGPDGNATFSFRVMTTGPIDMMPGGEPGPEPEMETQGPRAERIELDDRVILIVEGIVGENGPTARVNGSRVILEFADGRTDPMEFETKAQIDVKESSISFRNGVAELNLVKAKGRHAKTEGELRYE